MTPRHIQRPRPPIQLQRDVMRLIEAKRYAAAQAIIDAHPDLEWIAEQQHIITATR